jgi:membrane-associated protein
LPKETGVDVALDVIRYVLHLDAHLPELASQYGAWVYAILFGIVFAETGLVVTPFLPGDSLLFVAGAFAALGGMDLHYLIAALFTAAILGNTSNYWIGRFIGPRAFHWDQSRWFNRRALLEAHAFYEKYGGVTLTVARFMPFVRTFAPFVAGIGAMSHLKFQLWNVFGGLLWVVGFVIAGYFFGNVELVKKNLATIMLIVVVVSLIPLAIGVVRSWKEPPAA